MNQKEIVLARLSCELDIEKAMLELGKARQQMIEIQNKCQHPDMLVLPFVDCKIRYCPDCRQKHVFQEPGEYP